MLFGLTSTSNQIQVRQQDSEPVAHSSKFATRSNGLGLGRHSRLTSTDEDPVLEDEELQKTHDDLLDNLLQQISSPRTSREARAIALSELEHLVGTAMASRPMPTSKSSSSSTSSSKGGSRRHERSLSETRSAPYRVFEVSQNKPHLAVAPVLISHLHRLHQHLSILHSSNTNMNQSSSSNHQSIASTSKETEQSFNTMIDLSGESNTALSMLQGLCLTHTSSRNWVAKRSSVELLLEIFEAPWWDNLNSNHESSSPSTSDANDQPFLHTPSHALDTLMCLLVHEFSSSTTSPSEDPDPDPTSASLPELSNDLTEEISIIALPAHSRGSALTFSQAGGLGSIDRVMSRSEKKRISKGKQKETEGDRGSQSIEEDETYLKCHEFLTLWWTPELLEKEGRGGEQQISSPPNINSSFSKSDDGRVNRFPLHSTVRLPSSSSSSNTQINGKSPTSDAISSIFRLSSSNPGSDRRSTIVLPPSPPTPKARTGNQTSSSNKFHTSIINSSSNSSEFSSSVDSFRTALGSTNFKKVQASSSSSNPLLVSSPPPETPRLEERSSKESTNDSRTPRATLSSSSPSSRLSNSLAPNSAIRRERASDKYQSSPRKNRSDSPSKITLSRSPSKSGKLKMEEVDDSQADGSPSKRSQNSLSGGKEAKRRLPVKDDSLNNSNVSNQILMGPPQSVPLPKTRAIGSTPSSNARYPEDIKKSKTESSRTGSGGALTNVGKTLEKKDRNSKDSDGNLVKLPSFVTPSRNKVDSSLVESRRLEQSKSDELISSPSKRRGGSKGSQNNGLINDNRGRELIQQFRPLMASPAVIKAQKARDASPNKGKKSKQEEEELVNRLKGSWRAKREGEGLNGDSEEVA